MKINIITIFPDFFYSAISYSMIKKSQEKGLVDFNIINLRNYTEDKYQSVDDHPYGGGPGMIMMLDPVYKALSDLKFPKNVVLPSAKGKNWNQTLALEFSKFNEMTFIIPHFEGIDQRVIDNFVDYEVSVGPYILSGGELPSMIIIDSFIRLINGVLGNSESLLEESFNDNSLEYPQYTRPKDYELNNGEILSVPDVLLSGNHKEIEIWRKNLSKKL